MEQTFTLIRLISTADAEAEASNDVWVKYQTPVVEFIEKGVSLEECQASLKKIEDEVEYFKVLIERRQKIYINRSKTRSQWDEMQTELENNIIKEKNKYLDNFYLRSGDGNRLWDKIESRMSNICGNYLILPSYFKGVY